MQPVLNIERVRADRFTYCVGVTRSAARSVGDLFDSVERCLSDAGDSLHSYFDAVSICYHGVLLGTHSVERLRAEPVRVLDELGLRRRSAQRSRTGGKP